MKNWGFGAFAPKKIKRWGHRDVNSHPPSGTYPDLPLVLMVKSGQIQLGHLHRIFLEFECYIDPDIEERILKAVDTLLRPEIDRILTEYFDEILAGNRPC